MTAPLRVVLVKPSNYAADGYVERFRRGFMPNSTLAQLRSLTPPEDCEVHAFDEYVETDLDYLDLLGAAEGRRTLVALVGVQSHQLNRALDLAALARSRGAEACVIGGPHAMTCDTSMLQGNGVAFALSEAEVVWPWILDDARGSELRASYGRETRWQQDLAGPDGRPPALLPPTRRELKRHVVPLAGIHPARGCPYACNFCSVIKISGQRVRTAPVETTLASMRAAKAAGVRMVLFTSDNLNKMPGLRDLLNAMIEERLELPFFAQCDALIHRDEELVALLARAGCFQIFVGVESFSREALESAHKLHNDPERYARIVELCRRYGIAVHFSSIVGFPSESEEAVHAHLGRLKELDPDMASFWVLTPIPGTEQYDEFLEAGLITESNLDRYEGASVTWRHPRIGAARLRELFFHCYREFNRARDVSRRLARMWRGTRDFRKWAALYSVGGSAAMARIAVHGGRHPLTGGISRVCRDRVDDYLELRRERFGIDMAPLPRSLELSRADLESNRLAKLAVG